jgi:hypothetical protein
VKQIKLTQNKVTSVEYFGEFAWINKIGGNV